MNSVQETSDNPATKALIFTGFSNRADGPAALQVSSRNLPHVGPVHETSDILPLRKRLNPLKWPPVASLRNLQNRQASRSVHEIWHIRRQFTKPGTRGRIATR
jgi:hypothetical protein